MAKSRRCRLGSRAYLFMWRFFRSDAVTYSRREGEITWMERPRRGLDASDDTSLSDSGAARSPRRLATARAVPAGGGLISCRREGEAIITLTESADRTTARPAPGRPIRTALVEDQREIREVLAELIGCADGFECVGSYRSMEEALPRLGGDRPDVVLVDIGLPGISGIEGIRRIKRSHPDMLLVVLSVYDDDGRIFEALCAGACGYLLKKTPPDRLLASLEEVVAGGSPMSPEVARRVVGLFRRFRPPARAEHDLTPHETRILGLLVEGHSYKTAAAELGISVNTIAFHIKHIYGKLQVHSKSEAVTKALRGGVLD